MYSTSGSTPTVDSMYETLMHMSDERDRLKDALERIVKLVDPPGGPRGGSDIPVLTIAVRALENL